MKLIITIKDRKLDLGLFEEKISKLEDGRYEVNIKKSRSIRSTNQNNYYWGVVIEELYHLFKKTVTPTQIHEFLGYKFLSHSYRNQMSDELITTITSTTKLNTKQFEEFLERCRKYSMEEYNHRIRLPNETDYNY